MKNLDPGVGARFRRMNWKLRVSERFAYVRFCRTCSADVLMSRFGVRGRLIYTRRVSEVTGNAPRLRVGLALSRDSHENDSTERLISFNNSSTDAYNGNRIRFQSCTRLPAFCASPPFPTLTRFLAMNPTKELVAILILACWIPIASAGDRFSVAPATEASLTYDIVIYGGTSSGIAAAVQAKRMGKSVVVIEPTQRIGGLTTGGLGQTDIGNKAAIGGVAREFYQAVHAHYQSPEAWKWQTKDDYRSGGQSRSNPGEETMWTFEPGVALSIYQSWVDEHQIPVVYGERLNRESGVVRTRSIPARIVSIEMESGKKFAAKMWIDATYEGDLMAAAGVDSTIGREPNARYDETLNGVQASRAIHHQFVDNVDPYVTPGNPSSGTLPFIDPEPILLDGTGDGRVQAYCFRMCMTDYPENRIAFVKPENYNPSWYELLLRNFEAGERRVPLSIGAMPNRKTDTNNNFGVSTDFIGQNYDYPDGSYERRDEIASRHLDYQRGLMWTLAYHPRVPESIRNSVSRWGMCRDEFTQGNGWQQQLYIREARRMVSDYVMTQHHCQGREVAETPVGMAAYTMDSHHVQRYVTAEGKVRNEGDVQVGGFAPYPIDFKSIVPKSKQCGNLLVPVCLSASHMAFGSIRMEPVFMVLGQSAATAAVHAIDQGVPVQEIDTAGLNERLLADGQVLQWTASPRSPSQIGRLTSDFKGLVIDDSQAKRSGFDSPSTSAGPFIGSSYRHDANAAKGEQSIDFIVRITEAGRYEVRIAYTSHSNRATNVPVTIHHAGGESTVTVNQRDAPKIEGIFESVGTFLFQAETDYTIRISNQDTNGYVIADAIQVLAQ